MTWAFAFIEHGINTLLFTMVYKIPYVGSRYPA